MPVKNAFAVPIPKEKQKFLGQLNYPKESRAEFLVTQAGYIRKRFWILSFILIITIIIVLRLYPVTLEAVGIISAGLSLVLTALTFISCMIIYGFDGSQAAIQNLTPLSVYPLKMGELAVICTICVLFANLLTSGITLLLSSKFKSPFGVIIISGVIIMAPMFVNPPETNILLNNLLCLLPANMAAIWNIISEIMFEFGRISIEPYIFMPLFGAGLSAVLLPFAYKAFKNHQI